MHDRFKTFFGGVTSPAWAPIDPHPNHYKFLATPIISEVTYLLRKCYRINYHALLKRAILHTGSLPKRPLIVYKKMVTLHK